MIEFDNFSFKYAHAENYALKGVNLKIESGEFVILAGDSGSGKSTFLRAINGLIPHFYGGEYCGEIRVLNMNPIKEKVSGMRGYVATLLQDPESQILMNSVEREIAFQLENIGLKRSEITKRVEEVIDLLDINHLRSRKTSELSGGEKQKVALAAVMATHPRILLLDEPMSQVDPKSAENLLAMVSRFNDEFGITTIVAEHRMEGLIHRADRLIVLKDGTVSGDGEPRIVASRIDLEKYGVSYPPVAALAKHRNVGFLPLTVKEAKKPLCPMLKNAKFFEDEEEDEEQSVELRKVKFNYENRTVLRGLNLKIPKRGAIAIVGRNGSGKTTLAKLVLGLLKPSGGKIKYNVPKSSIGMVFQNPALHILGNSVEEDVYYTLKARGEKDDGRVDKTLRELGIEHLRNRNPLDLSGGEQLMFALATVLVFKPKLLILDEPTRGISLRFRRTVEKVIRKQAKRGAVLLISHDMELVASNCTKVHVLSEGRIILSGNRRDVLSQSLTLSPQLNKLAQACDGANKKILTEADVL